MLATLVVILRLLGLLCRWHRAVALENLALRQQLAALMRTPKCLIRRPSRRIRPCESSRRAMVIVKQTAQPSTSTNATNGPVRHRSACDQCVLDPW